LSSARGVSDEDSSVPQLLSPIIPADCATTAQCNHYTHTHSKARLEIREMPITETPTHHHRLFTFPATYQFVIEHYISYLCSSHVFHHNKLRESACICESNECFGSLPFGEFDSDEKEIVLICSKWLTLFKSKILFNINQIRNKTCLRSTFYFLFFSISLFLCVSLLFLYRLYTKASAENCLYAEL